VLGQPLIQVLNSDELIFEIQKNLNFLIDNLPKLKIERIEEEIIEINNLFLQYEKNGRRN